MNQIDVRKALAAGLKFRQLLETIADTLEWTETNPEGFICKVGMKQEREAEILQAWHARELKV